MGSKESLRKSEEDTALGEACCDGTALGGACNGTAPTGNCCDDTAPDSACCGGAAPDGICCDGSTPDSTPTCSNEAPLVKDALRLSGKPPKGLDVSFTEPKEQLRLLGGFGARLGRGIRTSVGLLTEVACGVDLASLSLNSSRRVLTLDLGEAKASRACSSLIGS